MIAHVLFLTGFFSSAPGQVADPLKVTVSILPQKYFIQKIGGDLLDVSVMVLRGASPATYEPRPQQMVAVTQSKIYFAIGVPFEKVWLRKFAKVNPEMTIIHTEDGIEKMPMKGHRHEGEGAQDPGIKDPHVWLSPPLVMVQARNILDALLKVDPAHGQTYERNYKSFVGELVDLDLEIRSILSREGEGRKFMVYHPSWGYFAKSYGLKQIPIEAEGKAPTPKELESLIQFAKEEGVKVIFVQPQFSTKSANTIAHSLGGQVMFADPLALDWAGNLLKVAEKFRAASR